MKREIEVDKLIPFENNARLHSDAQIAEIAASIDLLGFNDPIEIAEDYTILAGHGRWLAAKKLGLETVPCVILKHLKTDAEKRAYIIANNKIAENSSWDKEMLALELEVLNDLDDESYIDVVGFTEKELNALLYDADEVPDDDFDIDAESEKPAFVEPGDIWILGRHRLLCGDATKPEDVKLVMGGKLANACITDPPYNCSYKGGTGMTIQNDSWTDSEAFYQFLSDAFKNIYDNLTDGGAFYCFHSDAEKVNFYNAAVNNGFHYSTTCVWVKDTLVLGRMDYNMRHEPVLYCWKDTGSHNFYGDRKQTTVWEFDRPKKSELHPTMKTIPLVAYPMKLSTQENGVILDPFGGSGTTLMAAERTNRTCCTIELDPKYASAIVRRYVAEVQSTDGITVVRGSLELPCSEVYSPTAEDMAFKENKVNQDIA